MKNTPQPLKLNKDKNHSHYWIENGVLYESYKTIRGVRYRELLKVSGMANVNQVTQAEIQIIETQFLNT